MQHSGALYSFNNIVVQFKGKSTMIFQNNSAVQLGGAVYLNDKVSVEFMENTRATFCVNKAIRSGGALCYWFSPQQQCLHWSLHLH